MKIATPSAVLALLGAGSLVLAACDSETTDCGGPEITPHQSPVNFGDLYPLAEGEAADPASKLAVPYEWVLLLRAGCAPVTVSELCIVGDAHDGVEGDTAFIVEGPVPSNIPAGEEGAVRITFDHQAPNTVDADGDGVVDPDGVALVVQSDAVNFPTLVVPICARVIPPESERALVPCASPVTVEPGEYRPDLCAGI